MDKTKLKNPDSGQRVLLSTQATLQCQDLLKKLKKSHCKTSLSDLTSEIISRYFVKTYSEKEEKVFEKKFFNKKDFLRSLLKNATTEEEIQEAVERLKFFNTKERKQKRGKSRERTKLSSERESD